MFCLFVFREDSVLEGRWAILGDLLKELRQDSHRQRGQPTAGNCSYFEIMDPPPRGKGRIQIKSNGVKTCVPELERI